MYFSNRGLTSVAFGSLPKITGGKERVSALMSVTLLLTQTLTVSLTVWRSIHDLGHRASLCLSKSSWCPDADADLWPPCKMEQGKSSINGGEIDRIYWLRQFNKVIKPNIHASYFVKDFQVFFLGLTLSQFKKTKKQTQLYSSCSN